MISRKYTYRNIFIGFLILSILILKLSSISQAETIEYKVYELSLEEEGNKKEIIFGEPIFSSEDFNEAKEVMLEYEDGVMTHDSNPSPLKIVAATRSQAQSFPYRTGYESGAATLKIFKKENLTSRHTYIPAHYMMYVYDYILNSGRIVANVEIQGGKGYVEIIKTDIIPMIYIENGLSIKLGGKGTYNADSKKTYSIVPFQEEYRVYENDGINEINVKLMRPYPGLSVELTYGVAPDFLEVGEVYYSPDGVKFYRDRDLEERVGGDYYSYFQWLPLRSMTNHNPEAFENFLNYYGKYDSVMMNETYHFLEQGEKYGMNAAFVFQQANLESGYGTSAYAKNRNNLFGWGAPDANPDLAKRYDNIGQAIAIHMDKQIGGYMEVDDWRHYGASFGNKAAGITVAYASDPYYGIKIATMYYRMDKINGFKDLNAYDLALLEDDSRYRVINAETDIEWYRTKSGLENQVIINLGRQGGKIKTIPWQTKSNGTLNAYSDFAYIEDSSYTIEDIEAYGKHGELPEEPDFGEIEFEDEVQARTTANLKIRRSHGTSSAELGIIAKGTEITIEPTKIGWARTTYNGITGFVSMDYLEILNGKEPGEYGSGDINGDGVIDILDMMSIRLHILGIEEFDSEGEEFADINGDGVIDILDMMAIRLHILGISPLS